MSAPMVVAAAFLAYVQQVLCPTLRRGDIVILDNLSSHEEAGVREAVEAAGAELITCRRTIPT
jgi:hypothetical protein